MANLILICSTNHVFPSGLSVENVRHLTLSGNKSQCPYDGEMVAWPEGTFNAIEGVLTYIKESKDPEKTSREVAEELMKGTGKHLDEIKRRFPQLVIDSIVVLRVCAELLHGGSVNINAFNRQTIINQYNNYCVQQQSVQPTKIP